MDKVKDLFVTTRMPISVFRRYVFQDPNGPLQCVLEVAGDGVTLPHAIQCFDTATSLECRCLVPKLMNTLQVVGALAVIA